MAASDQIDNIINTALEMAQSNSEAAQQLASDAGSKAPPVVTGTINAIYPPDMPTIDFAPDMNAATEYKDAADALEATLYAALVPQFTDFLTRYYPNYSTLMAAAEAWMLNAIQNGGSGLPANIWAAIWNRARERELTEGNRLKDEALAEFAGRGFVMPPGALAARFNQIDATVQNKTAEANREAAIKEAEMELENIKFSVQQANTLRQQAIAQAIEYFRMYLSIPKVATDRAAALAELRMKMWETTAAYYRAITAQTEILFKYDAANLESQIKQLESITAYSTATYHAQVSGAVSAAESVAKVAAAAINSQTGIAHLSDQTSRKA
jgi:hypothetical protein